MSIGAEISAERINNGDDVISVLILIVCLVICSSGIYIIHSAENIVSVHTAYIAKYIYINKYRGEDLSELSYLTCTSGSRERTLPIGGRLTGD